jgi:hypothetical protein
VLVAHGKPPACYSERSINEADRHWQGKPTIADTRATEAKNRTKAEDVEGGNNEEDANPTEQTITGGFAHGGRSLSPNGPKLSDGGWRSQAWSTGKSRPPASVRWSALLGGAGVAVEMPPNENRNDTNRCGDQVALSESETHEGKIHPRVLSESLRGTARYWYAQKTSGVMAGPRIGASRTTQRGMSNASPRTINPLTAARTQLVEITSIQV